MGETYRLYRWKQGNKEQALHVIQIILDKTEDTSVAISYFHKYRTFHLQFEAFFLESYISTKFP